MEIHHHNIWIYSCYIIIIKLQRNCSMQLTHREADEELESTCLRITLARDICSGSKKDSNEQKKYWY